MALSPNAALDTSHVGDVRGKAGRRPRPHRCWNHPDHQAHLVGIITDVTDEQLRSALSAASAVGDERIQEIAQGQVNDESWTHPSAQQRQQWFQRGYTNGDSRACDTFAAQ